MGYWLAKLELQRQMLGRFGERLSPPLLEHPSLYIHLSRLGLAFYNSEIEASHCNDLFPTAMRHHLKSIRRLAGIRRL